ncbi:serine/threonine protein phosphatase PrpC [Kitasatospora sp. MAA4]|uniref:PP2C family serine/threonine-protein phosphatase n=1 Tax=Kitasatospora sp. MAA4 TaxID=3035093 RepID=UPI002475E63D|nr:PP2C family serine/threonine-protein phosphatase [Kitasatospora sp. MAA4]MDH6135836.1 serine/threonine protein phosphatase PrpC [Kitasatospora sp. MAA4]
MPQQTVCPTCAEPLDPDDVFCGVCGMNLSAPPPVPAPSTEPDFELEPAAGAGPGCVHCGGRQVAPDGYCEACGGVQPRPRDHMEQSLPGVAGVSDRGVRHHRNEDSFMLAATSLPGGASAVLAVVCDGVSSASRPDEASQAAAEAASQSLLSTLEQGVAAEPAMRQAILTAADAVAALAYDGTAPTPHSNSPACTFVSTVAAAGVVTVGWVGDSRAYWIPDDREGAEPYRLTEDDSWAARMVSAGLMGEAEAYADARAHAITGWLGADAEEVEPHTVSFTPHVPGVLLVCTDGLWNYAEAATQLADLVRADARADPLRAARVLVDFAITAGGHDNITVAVLPVAPLTVEGYTETLLDMKVLGPLPTQPAAPLAPPMPPVPPAVPAPAVPSD